MSVELKDLWPKDIGTDVVSPLAIMKYQAAQLEKRTNGILRAYVSLDKTDNEVVAQFIVEAPAANEITSELFHLTYSKLRCYPCQVYGPEMKNSYLDENFDMRPSGCEEAVGQSDLMEKIKRILNSSEVRSTLDSFIAISNEVGVN